MTTVCVLWTTLLIVTNLHPKLSPNSAFSHSRPLFSARKSSTIWGKYAIYNNIVDYHDNNITCDRWTDIKVYTVLPFCCFQCTAKRQHIACWIKKNLKKLFPTFFYGQIDQTGHKRQQKKSDRYILKCSFLLMLSTNSTAILQFFRNVFITQVNIAMLIKKLYIVQLDN